MSSPGISAFESGDVSLQTAEQSKTEPENNNTQAD